MTAAMFWDATKEMSHLLTGVSCSKAPVVIARVSNTLHPEASLD